MTTRLLYPENPTVPGALSRDELMRVGHKYFQEKSQATDYDMISAAVRANSIPSIEVCLDAGISAFGDTGSTILKLVAYEVYDQPSAERTTELLKTIVRHRNFDRKRLREGSWELMARLIMDNNVEAFDVLLEAGADPYEKSAIGQGILHTACLARVSMDTLEHLLARYPDMLNAKDQSGTTPLLIAASSHLRPDVVYMLLEKGADPLALDENTGGLLHNLAWEKYHEGGMDLDRVVRELKSRIGEEKWEELTRQDSITSISLPVISMARKNLDMDFSALAPGGDVNAVSGSEQEQPTGRTSALGVAISHGCWKTVRRLLGSGADLERITDKGHTCWHMWAVMTEMLRRKMEGSGDDYEEVLERNIKLARRLFLKRGVSTEKLTSEGEHPLMYTESDQAREFFAKQRRKELATIAKKKPGSGRVAKF